jgi:hypothetical protein
VGERHEGLVNLVLPGTMGPDTEEVADRRTRLFKLLIQMVDVYERSFAPIGKREAKGTETPRKRIQPAVSPPPGEGALPQLVAHGFVSLPPPLIDALRAPDGGNLRWLGTTENVHDFMHFELHPDIAQKLLAGKGPATGR